MRCGSSLVRAGLLLAALCPAPAFAQCVLEIDPTNLRNAIGYDPLAIDRTIAEQDLRLVNNGTEVCTARLTVDDGGSAVDEAVMGNSRLQVSWVDGNNISLAANRTAGAGSGDFHRTGREHQYHRASCCPHRAVGPGRKLSDGNQFAADRGEQCIAGNPGERADRCEH